MRSVAWLTLALSLLACDSFEGAEESPEAVMACTPGDQKSCACPASALAGAQRCLPDGGGYGECQCVGSGGEAGKGGAGASAGKAGAGSGAGGIAGGGAGSGAGEGGAGAGAGGAGTGGAGGESGGQGGGAAGQAGGSAGQSCTPTAAPPVVSCGSGKTLHGGSCLLPYQPTLSVSSLVVAPGDQVQVTWNGGAYATNCAIAQWASAPSGRGVATINSETIFQLTCIDSGGNYLSPAPEIKVSVETGPLQKFYHDRSVIELKRAAAWASPGSIWEVEYDGVGTPLDHVTMAFAWDNPVDDDGIEIYNAGRGFRFDEPEVGLLTVDRHTDPGDWPKGGVISRRDEFLDNAYGFTAEFRARISPDSGVYKDADGVEREHNAFSLHYQKENGVVTGVFLTPKALKIGGYLNPSVEVALDTTAYNTYRVVQDPASTHVAVYVNDSSTPILEGEGNSLSQVSSVHDHEHPTIFVGGEGVFRSHFTLDHVRYRRGAYPPGSSIPPPLTRAPSPLPPPLPPCTTEPFIEGFDGATLPGGEGTPVWGINGGPGPGWKLLPGGILELDEIGGGLESVLIPGAAGLTGKGDITVEIRARVHPDSDPRGFSFYISDDMGMNGLFLSPDAVETTLGIKNVGWRDVGIQRHEMKTTDDFHIYRLVRPANQFYAHLYVDNDPQPVIVDQHPDGSTRVGPGATESTVLLVFGHIFSPSLAAGVPARSHVDIDYIRWSPSAYGPPVP